MQTLADRDARLLTTEGSEAVRGVELTHEALIRGWALLREWIGRERDGLRTHRRLTEAAGEWAAAAAGAADKDEYLYAGARLAVVREWAAAHRDELSVLEATFLAACEEQERDALDEERRRRLAAEAAAARQQHLSRRFLAAAVTALLLAAASAGLARLALAARDRARTAAAERSEGVADAERRKALAEADRADANAERATRGEDLAQRRAAAAGAYASPASRGR